jgi:hypothetical protein
MIITSEDPGCLPQISDRSRTPRPAFWGSVAVAVCAWHGRCILLKWVTGGTNCVSYPAHADVDAC